MPRRPFIRFLEQVLRLILIGFLGSVSAYAATFTVTNTSDSGPGSMRQAILGANESPGADLIAFAIPGLGTHHIILSSALPALMDDSGVTIDGFTQPGASKNTDANGDNAVRPVEVDASQSIAFVIQSSNNTIRGLQIGGLLIPGCCSGGVFIASGSGNAIEGNLIRHQSVGVNIGSAANFVGGPRAEQRNWFRRNSAGILIYGSQATRNVVKGNFLGELRRGFDERNLVAVVIDGGASDNLVGGTEPGARNVVSGNEAGISIQGGEDTSRNRVEGNLIGPDPSGLELIGNGGAGVSIGGISADHGPKSNTIGGILPAARNVIRGNGSFGIQIAVASGNFIVGNLIGADTTPEDPDFINTSGGIRLIGTSSENAIQSNTIAFNGGPGIVADALAFSVGNSITTNSIHHNTGLGIDLVPLGVTANDPGDSDEGPNDLQNFPLLNEARSGGGFTMAQGILESIPARSYVVEVFVNSECDPSGNGEGESFLASTSVTTNDVGVGSFTVIRSGSAPIGGFLTATATDSEGNTSEFSPCRVVVAGPTPGVEMIPMLGAAGLAALIVLLGLVGLFALRL